MARLVLSNNKQIVDNFVNHCNSVGFTKGTRIEAPSPEKLYGAVFKKLCIDNQNYQAFEGGDFVTAVGTFFYKGVMGEKALKHIYDDFAGHKDICKIRQEMNGAFVLAVSYGGTLYAISDALGCLQSYYHCNEADGTWVFGNSLYEMVRSSTFKCTANEFNLIQEAYSKCFLCEDTIFNEYKRLTGENYIKVDLNKNCSKICHIENDAKIDERPLNEIVNDSAKAYNKIGSVIKSNFKNGEVAICMTGGIDSRTAMATLLSAGIKPEMYYGIGNSLLTNTTLGDLEINKLYSEKFGLNLHLMDWSTPEKVDSAWDASIDKWGVLATMYSASPAVYKSFESIKEPIVFIGCLGELYRTDTDASSVEQIGEDYLSLEQLLRFTYEGKDINELLGDDSSSYMMSLLDRIKTVIAPYDEGDKIQKKNFIFLRYQIEKLSDTLVVNFMNQMRYCMSLFAEPTILRYAMILPEYRENARYIIHNLNAIYPPILEIPVYSRHQWVTIDKKEMQLPAAQVSAQTAKHRFTREYFLRYTKIGRWTRKTIYPLYMRRNEKQRIARGQIKKDNYIPFVNLARQLNGVFHKLSFFKRKIHTMSSGYIPNDAKLAILLTAIKKLNINLEK